MRERLLSLAAGVNAEVCPFNDPTPPRRPQAAAAVGWRPARVLLRPGCGNVQVLRDTEDMLLWRHRVETGLSAEANYGRFYPGYARPANRWIVRGGRSGARTPGRRAVPLALGSAMVDFAASRPALQGEAGPLQPRWWQRAPLTEAPSLPPGPAVYCIHDRGTEEPVYVYVGETAALPARAVTHAAASWPTWEPWLAYLPLSAGTPKHVLRELESDLVGWRFWRTGRASAAV